MKIKYLVLGVLSFTFFACQQSNVQNNEEVESPEDESSPVVYAAADPCLADASWFNTNGAGKRMTPKPAEGSSSVFGNNNTVTNCDFHRWSWQKFLWMTNENSAGKPHFITNFIQVTNQNVNVQNSDYLTLTETKQATGNVLTTNSTYSTDGQAHTVYYSLHADSSLYNTVVNYASKDPSEYANVIYPIGSVELKVSWVEAAAVRDTTTYFMTDAKLPGATKTTRVAMLGMHVVGAVYNHPELVWATFERDDLAPFYDWTNTTDKDVPVTTTKNYLLFDSTHTGTIADLPYKNPATNNTFNVNRLGVPIQAHASSDTTFLVTSQTEPTNIKHIESINADVKTKLTGVLNNYHYNGSIWINTVNDSYPDAQIKLLVDTLGKNIDDVTKGKRIRGCASAYNITMETYEQIGLVNQATSISSMDLANVANCFSCHKANKGSTLNFSHIFNGAVDKHKKGLTSTESKELRRTEMINYIQSMKKE